MTGLPPSTVLDADSGLRSYRQFRTLLGGTPPRVLHLTSTGAEVARHLIAGRPAGHEPRHRTMARRLVEAGMAHIDYDASLRSAELGGGPGGAARPSPGSVSVVVPVRDEPAGLEQTLRCLLSCHELGLDLVEIVVVDDGSIHPVEGRISDRLRSLPTPDPNRADRRPTSFDPLVIRNRAPQGPAAARNRGLEATTGSTVVFIDAGVTFDGAGFARLLLWWPDDVVAMAPRVRSQPGVGAVSRYELTRSPLDMGPTPGLVGPHRPVPYVPSTMLAVRRSGLAAIGGFDVTLRFGEDVDLVWRLVAAAWVQYRPDVVVRHPPRSSVADLARQRLGYGSSAAPLSRRHGPDLAPFRLQWSAAGAALTAAGHPATGLGTTLLFGERLRRRLRAVPDPGPTATVLTATGWWFQLQGLLVASARTWWPLLAFGLPLTRTRRRCAALLAAGWARRLLDRSDESPPVVTDLTLGAIDDTAYGLGVWMGAIRNRTARPLLPQRARIRTSAPATGR